MKAAHPQTPPRVDPPHKARLFRVLRFDHVEPDRTQIHRLVGLEPGRDGHRRWLGLTDRMLAELPRLLRPRGLFRIDEVVALQPRRVVLASRALFEGAVGTFLEHSQLVATFIVTIGSALERLSRGWLRSGKVMQGAIADAIASQAAEAAAQRLTEEVRAWARAWGLDITPPYSPGHCGMTVRQQIPLFASLPAHQINVRITPSCLMLPIKSISGLLGLGPADKISPTGYPCQACTHPDCTQRRAPLDKDPGTCQDWGEVDERYPPPEA